MVNIDDKFNSVEDLYKRVMPAIKTKCHELNMNKINYIDELDIWNYCVKSKWTNKKDLRIYEMVDDILNSDILELIKFVKNNNYNQKIDKDE